MNLVAQRHRECARRVEDGMTLAERLEAQGKQLGEREAANAAAIAHATERSQQIHARVRAGLDGFHAGCKAGGAPRLVVDLSPPRVDDKHLHAVQFDLSRGRYRMIVTVKSKGEVTLVGPFKAGKQEGPCRSIPLADDAAIDEGLGEVLSDFLAEAFKP
jgi:hypothetical protein